MMVSTTIASVIELFGRLNDPERLKLETLSEVMVELAKVEVVNTVLVVKVIAPPANCIKGVPVTLFDPE